MIFILVLGVVVGYGQAAAEDKRRAQRRRGGTTIGTVQTRRRRSRRRPSPAQMQAIAPKLQRNHRGQSTPVQQPPPLHQSPNPPMGRAGAAASPQQKSNLPSNAPRPGS